MQLRANAFNRTIKFHIIRIFHLPRGHHVSISSKRPRKIEAYLCHQLLLLTLFQPTTLPFPIKNEWKQQLNGKAFQDVLKYH